MSRCFVGMLMLVSVMSCWADVTDKDQPMNFAADSIRVDEKKRLNVLLGNVEIAKGSIVLRAERVEVLQGRDGSQKATASGGSGGRALFRQRRQGLDEVIEGEAERVEYDSRADEVRFVGRAILRRLISGAMADEVAGQTIVYDNQANVFQVLGGQGSAAPQGRVRGVITPRRSSNVSPALVPADAARLATTTTLTAPTLSSNR